MSGVMIVGMNASAPILRAMVLLAVGTGASAAPPTHFRIERSTILTSSTKLHLSQSRGAVIPLSPIPLSPARVMVTTQEFEFGVTHGCRDLMMVETTDGGRTWTAPRKIESLRRARMSEGHDFVIGDVCPQWHNKTRTVLATGKTFGFEGGVKENRGFERVSYAVYSPESAEWTDLKLLKLPEKDHEGRAILEPNSGCHQRFDLPDGEILLPIRYRKDPAERHYTTIVARCSFDGRTLRYREHGTEFSLSRERGLYEPSVTGYRGAYFLTMRADHSAFVARGTDGIHYEPMIEWKFDDGEVLGSYNTQQHWVAHGDALYLVYTRRGANNDHVFRHRAPLFIAQVDLDPLCVLRATEQVLMPENGCDLGAGFGVLDYSPDETWIISTEMIPPRDRQRDSNRVLLAKLLWTRPNQLFSTAGAASK